MKRFPCNFIFLCILTFLLIGLPTLVLAQDDVKIDPGEENPVPWILGNAIFAGVLGSFFYLAIRSSRRSLSALDPKKKKKKEKKEPDFSKGPIYHPELSNNLGLTLIGWFTGFPLLFTLPASKKISEEVKNDPRYKGAGLAQFVVILNYIGLVIAPLLFLTVLGVGIWILIKSLNS